MTAQGYKLLPDQIRVIQGDGIQLETLVEILENLKALTKGGTVISTKNDRNDSQTTV